jgi:small subunit ribosomal protein S7
MVLAMNKWDTKDIKIEDEGLKKYISLKPILIPRTGARYAKNRFHKSNVFIVERLMNKLMVPGHKSKKHFKTSYHVTGKANTVYKLTYNTLEYIEEKTKQNPITVLVKAIENAAPREEIITIEYGGARYPKAVECAPQRRIDIALRYMTQGAYQKSFDSKKKSYVVLAEEILNAYNLNQSSAAIAKKLELERQADASR